MKTLLAALALAAGVAAQSPDPVLIPGPEQMPAWLEQGKVRFTRLDGGPIEILKTARSAWGMHFNDAEKEVLGNLYTKYGDRMIELLERAHINMVWLTWSVGYSWQDEAEQRAQCRRLVAKLHQRGIKAGAYLCSVSMFWESMFRDEPRSVRWITFDPQGLPFRYSGGRDPLRFIADVGNPEWVELQKRRIGEAIDAGFDAAFFDNTASAGWNDDARMDGFIAHIRRFIHVEKRSNLLLFTNYGLTPSRAALNRNMDFVYAESWREPGVWDGEWNTSNVRRTKLLRALIPDWKFLTTEYSIFHTGNRASTFLPPRSQKLATAEAAALLADHNWDMEGPFDHALMTGNPAAMAAWQAIGDIRGFLAAHEDLYRQARAVTPVGVLAPEAGLSFGWDREGSSLYDSLARQSALWGFCSGEACLDPGYRVLIVPRGTELTPAQKSIVARKGAAVLTDLEGIRALDAPHLSIEGAPYVMGVVNRLGSGRGLTIHLLNYAASPVSGLKIRLKPGKEFAALAEASPRLVTPDAQTAGLAKTNPAEFTLKTLDTYGVIVLENK